MIFIQRVKGPRRSEAEEREEYRVISQELAEDYLRVEEGTRCIVCKQSITKAVERHLCAVCEETVHVGYCLEVHHEECVRVDIRFDK